MDRSCADCGVVFSSAGPPRCWRCRQPIREKLCVDCGETFKGTTRNCYRCRTVDITCSCGRTFRDKAGRKHCFACRSKTRPCDECGKEFTGTALTCAPCKGQQLRNCVDCGKEFRKQTLRCNQCIWLARPYEERTTRALAAVNKRRAIKRDAEICGPVPAEVYALLRAAEECVYCGDPPTQVDHVRPLAQGGWEHESNLVPACGPCNHSKGPRLLTEWDPARVQYGVVNSERVADEYARLLAADDQLALPLTS